MFSHLLYSSDSEELEESDDDEEELLEDESDDEEDDGTASTSGGAIGIGFFGRFFKCSLSSSLEAKVRMFEYICYIT